MNCGTDIIRKVVHQSSNLILILKIYKLCISIIKLTLKYASFINTCMQTLWIRIFYEYQSIHSHILHINLYNLFYFVC